MRTGRAWLGNAPALRPLAFAAVGAVAATAAVARWQPDPWRHGTTLVLWAVTVGTVAVVLAARGRGTRTEAASADLVVGAASALAVLYLAVLLNGTPLLPFNADLTFRMAAATRFTSTWHLVDYTYRGLPAAYPPLLPWIAGRIGAVTGEPGWRALKGVSFGALAIMPPCAYALWRRLLPTLPAAFVAASSVLLFVAYQPEEWLSAALFVPWLLLVLETRTGAMLSRRVLVLGAIGAVLVPLYYFYLLPALLIVPIAVVAAGWAGRPVRLRTGCGVLVVTAVLSAWYWGPLLVSILTSAHVSPGQTSYLQPDALSALTSSFGLTLRGVADWVGVGYLLYAARRDTTARHLSSVLAGSGAWMLLGRATSLLIHDTLVYWRAAHLVSVVALAGCVLAVTRVLGWVRESGRARCWAPAAVAVLCVAAVVSGIDSLPRSRLITKAHMSALPNGSFPRYPHGPSDAALLAAERVPDAQVRLLRRIEEANARNTPDDQQLWQALGGPAAASKVVLSTRPSLEWYYPVYFFNAATPSYADAAAGYVQRRAFLSRLAAVRGPAEFLRLCRHNAFQPIDAFLLYRGAHGGLYYAARVDDFGFGTALRAIRFSRAQFPGSLWRVRDIGPYVLAQPRTRGPVRPTAAPMAAG